MNQLDRFRAQVFRQLQGQTPTEWCRNNPGKHLYARYNKYLSCAWCGKIKTDGPSTKCPGVQS
jgi:hypothetical protein